MPLKTSQLTTATDIATNDLIQIVDVSDGTMSITTGTNKKITAVTLANQLSTIGNYAAASHSHSNATTTANGFMSFTDKTKLDGMTSSLATTSLSGFMSKDDKNKLDGLSNYTHPIGDGNLHVPATGTTNEGKVLTAGSTAGSLSWITPTASDSFAFNSITLLNELSQSDYIVGYSSNGTTKVKTTISTLLNLIRNTLTRYTSIGDRIYDEVTGDCTGVEVDINLLGDIIAVSSHFSDAGVNDLTENRGSVRVFKWDGMQWLKLGQTIYGETRQDYLNSVSLNANGNILATGSSQAGENGEVRVFKYNTSTNLWELYGQKLQGNSSTLRSLGSDVGLDFSGNKLIVGAFGAGTSMFDYFGAIQAYQYNTSTSQWETRGSRIAGEAAGDFFGRRVAINGYDGNTIVASSTNNASERGHIRVYRWNSSTSAWTLIGELVGEAVGDTYGRDVDISADGDIVVVGANNNAATFGTGSNSGSVTISKYSGSGTTWTRIGNVIDAENSGEGFGNYVSINTLGTMIAAGAGTKARVYRWNQYSGKWEKLGEDIVATENNVVSLNGDGDILLLGSPEYTANSNALETQLLPNSYAAVFRVPIV